MEYVLYCIVRTPRTHLRWRKEAVEGTQEKPRSDSHPVLGAQPEQGVEHHAGLDWTGC